MTTIINTHTHFDHVSGNVEFPATVDVVTHENTAKLMQEMRPVTGGPDQRNVFKENNGRGLPKRTFKDRESIDDLVNSWKVPERFLKDGYMTPDDYQRLTRQPMTTRLRANAEVVWSETK